MTRMKIMNQRKSPSPRPVPHRYPGKLHHHRFTTKACLLILLFSSTCQPNAASLSSTSTCGTTIFSNHLISGGLVNLGNTCYLNAQLECAYHIPLLRNTILRPNSSSTNNHADTDSTTVADTTNNNNNNKEESISLTSLRHTFQQMKFASQQGNNDPQLIRSISPSTLCKNLGINVYEQQDSQEFWKLLLPEIDLEELTNLYKGRYDTYIAALDNTGREKVRQEVFLDLALDVTNFDHVRASLEDMFTSGVILLKKEDNGWRPEKGAEKVDAIKGNNWKVGDGDEADGDGGSLPKILQLHLMRFSYDWQTGVMSKIKSRFEFGKVLNLKGICSRDEDDGGDGAATVTNEDGLVYDLQSAVVHAGEYGSGHYYAYVRPNVRTNKWFRYDDDRVTPVSFAEVKDDAFGGHVVHRLSKKERRNPQQGLERQNRNKLGLWKRICGSVGGRRNEFGWGGRTSSAYMLQYVRRSDIPLLYD